jgi:NAD(P)-dependent dehydrogenase (short-subunit alcohol dehydrogenase family)
MLMLINNNIVTGCSSGLGRALTEYALAAGDKVVATLRNVSALASLQSTYPETSLLVLPLDVTQPTQIKSALDRAVEHFGRIDVVVNNAGYGLFCEIEGTPDEEARKEFEVQFWGPVNITKEVGDLCF